MNARVLIIVPTPPPYYGVAVATQHILTSSLNECFTIIHLDTSDRRSSLNFNRFELGNILLAIKHVFQMLWMILRHRPGIVYLPISQGKWGYLRDSLFILISAAGNAKIVLHLRGAYFKEFYCNSGPTLRQIIKRTLGLADRVLVLGETLLSLFDGLVPAEKLRVVPNGVNPGSFPRSGDNLKRNAKVRVCFISNLDRTKGFEEALHAVNALSQKHQIEYVVAGSWKTPNDLQYFHTYVRENYLENIVKFVGPVHGNEKLKLLSQSDIFVLPTYFPYEGQPWAILEAMAAALPVITTDHGCIAETVVDGETGFLVPKRDVPALMARLQQLVAEPGLRIEMGKKGRQRIESVYSEQRFVQRLKSVFEELV